MKRLRLPFVIVVLSVVATILLAACGGDGTPTPPPAAAPPVDVEAIVRDAVQQAIAAVPTPAPGVSPEDIPSTEEIAGLVQSAIAAIPPGARPGDIPSRQEIQALVETAVGAIPPSLTADQVRSLAEEAVRAAVSPGITRAELETAVSQAVEEAVGEAVEAAVAEAAPQIGGVNVINQWTAEPEAGSFRAVVQPWESLTGGSVDTEATRDITAIVTTRVQGGNPPDVAILSQPGLMERFAREGDLVPLDSFLNMDQVRAEYSQAWIDLCTVNGRLYCIAWKASNKSTVWYNPKTFTANGISVPTTWDELIAASDQLLAAGISPWSIGVESGGASGWPGTDWIGQLVLSESGPEVYDQWVNHDIPFNDPRIKSAWEKFGQVALTDGYVPGGSDFILTSSFVDASHLPFQDPPLAGMYFLGSFTQGFIEEQFPDLVVEEDYTFFGFPAIDPAFEGAVTGGADLIVMFKDNPSSRSLMEYLSGALSQQIWVERGGFTSTNGRVSLSNYPDPLQRKVAEQLVAARVFRFDADDLWGGDLQAAFWAGILDYLSNPGDLDTILADIEAVAAAQLD